MSEQLRCNQCNHITPVSEEDPDSSVSDAIEHVGMRHGIGPDLAMSMVIEIEDAPADVEIGRHDERA